MSESSESFFCHCPIMCPSEWGSLCPDDPRYPAALARYCERRDAYEARLRALQEEFQDVVRVEEKLGYVSPPPDTGWDG